MAAAAKRWFVEAVFARIGSLQYEYHQPSSFSAVSARLCSFCTKGNEMSSVLPALYEDLTYYGVVGPFVRVDLRCAVLPDEFLLFQLARSSGIVVCCLLCNQATQKSQSKDPAKKRLH
jgi:hypothetical protein